MSDVSKVKVGNESTSHNVKDTIARNSIQSIQEDIEDLETSINSKADSSDLDTEILNRQTEDNAIKALINKNTSDIATNTNSINSLNSNKISSEQAETLIEEAIEGITYPVTSVNGSTGNINLNGDNLYYKDNTSINNKIDAISVTANPTTTETSPNLTSLKIGDTSYKLAGGGSGGAATLNQLNDVSLSSLEDGQVLTYNSEDDKWENATPQGGGTTVTANPSEAASASLNKIKIEDTIYSIDGGVTSVNGKTGAVTLASSDISDLDVGVTSVNGRTGAVVLQSSDLPSHTHIQSQITDLDIGVSSIKVNNGSAQTGEVNITIPDEVVIGNNESSVGTGVDLFIDESEDYAGISMTSSTGPSVESLDITGTSAYFGYNTFNIGIYGKIAILNLVLSTSVAFSAGTTDYQIGTVPEGYRPVVKSVGFVNRQDTYDAPMSVMVKPSGEIALRAISNVQKGVAILGQVCWIIKEEE